MIWKVHSLLWLNSSFLCTLASVSCPHSGGRFCFALPGSLTALISMINIPNRCEWVKHPCEVKQNNLPPECGQPIDRCGWGGGGWYTGTCAQCWFCYVNLPLPDVHSQWPVIAFTSPQVAIIDTNCALEQCSWGILGWGRRWQVNEQPLMYVGWTRT
jgi:hypothetical protein